MSQPDKNVVRDRTLVLRVLVPGLHTSLNDKIASKQEGEGGTNPHPSPPSSSSSAAAASTGAGDQLLNLDGVTCLPSKKGDTLWHFRCDGATYPARLVNLPCPVEVHKTFDHTNYHKSADVGQMLIVYEDEYAMEEAENERGYRVDGFPSYYHSGLTPPMRKVVQRRFLSRFEERDTKPTPPPKVEVSAVEKEIQDLVAKLGSGKGGKGKPKGRGASSSSAAARGKEIKVVEEEVVDYEPWMGDGGVFTVDEAKMHPECWLTRAEMKEIEETKKVLQEEQRAKEREAAEEERQRQEEERKKMEEKAEKKKRKKEKKKKKQQEEAEASPCPSPTSLGDGKKKGIPSLKNREGAGADLAAVAEGEGGEMDDVTAAALANINGTDDLQEHEDFLLNDEMFDFENDDITNLLG